MTTYNLVIWISLPFFFRAVQISAGDGGMTLLVRTLKVKFRLYILLSELAVRFLRGNTRLEVFREGLF